MTLYHATPDDPEVVKDVLTNGIHPDDDGVILLCDTMTIAGNLFIDTYDYTETDDETGDIQLAVFTCDIRFNDDDDRPLKAFKGYDVDGLGAYGIHEPIPPEKISKDVHYLGFGDVKEVPPRSPEEYRERIDNKEQLIIDALGYHGAFVEVSKALSYDMKNNIYDYIIRCHDLGGDAVLDEVIDQQIAEANRDDLTEDEIINNRFR